MPYFIWASVVWSEYYDCKKSISIIISGSNVTEEEWMGVWMLVLWPNNMSKREWQGGEISCRRTVLPSRQVWNKLAISYFSRWDINNNILTPVLCFQSAWCQIARIVGSWVEFYLGTLPLTQFSVSMRYFLTVRILREDDSLTVCW